MRTPVPLNGHPVRATLVTNQEEALRDDDEELDDDELDDDELDDDELDDDGDDESDLDDEIGDATPEEKDAREVASDSAPWSPVPLRPARDFVKRNKNAGIEIQFPTVYEEDRSEKMKDLTTAQAVGSITHQRMSEQIAKELGFEQYDYDEELEAIKVEMRRLPSSILSSTGEIAGASGNGAGDDTGFSNQPQRRDDLSHGATTDFRAQQRSLSSRSEAVKQQQLLKELRQLREGVTLLLSLSDKKSAQPVTDDQRQFNELREELRHLRETLTVRNSDSVSEERAALIRLTETVGRMLDKIGGAAPSVTVGGPTINVPPINVEVQPQPAPTIEVHAPPVPDVKVNVESPSVHVDVHPPEPRPTRFERDPKTGAITRSVPETS